MLGNLLFANPALLERGINETFSFPFLRSRNENSLNGILIPFPPKNYFCRKVIRKRIGASRKHPLVVGRGPNPARRNTFEKYNFDFEKQIVCDNRKSYGK